MVCVGVVFSFLLCCWIGVLLLFCVNVGRVCCRLLFGVIWEVLGDCWNIIVIGGWWLVWGNVVGLVLVGFWELLCCCVGFDRISCSGCCFVICWVVWEDFSVGFGDSRVNVVGWFLVGYCFNGIGCWCRFWFWWCCRLRCFCWMLVVVSGLVGGVCVSSGSVWWDSDEECVWGCCGGGCWFVCCWVGYCGLVRIFVWLVVCWLCWLICFRFFWFYLWKYCLWLFVLLFCDYLMYC